MSAVEKVVKGLQNTGVGCSLSTAPHPKSLQDGFSSKMGCPGWLEDLKASSVQRAVQEGVQFLCLG